MSFLVPWSICWSSSLVHFKKSLEYLTRGDSQSNYTFDEFVFYSYVSSSFIVPRRNFSEFFFLLHSFDGDIFPSIYKFFLLLIRLDLVVLFLSQLAVFRFSLWVYHIFLCQIFSLYRHCRSSLLVFFNSFFHFWQRLWCRCPCTWVGRSFFAIYEVCIHCSIC